MLVVAVLIVLAIIALGVYFLVIKPKAIAVLSGTLAGAMPLSLNNFWNWEAPLTDAKGLQYRVLGVWPYQQTGTYASPPASNVFYHDILTKHLYVLDPAGTKWCVSNEAAPLPVYQSTGSATGAPTTSVVLRPCVSGSAGQAWTYSSSAKTWSNQGQCITLTGSGSAVSLTASVTPPTAAQSWTNPAWATSGAAALVAAS